jgi:hypothetical protein
MALILPSPARLGKFCIQLLPWLGGVFAVVFPGDVFGIL